MTITTPASIQPLLNDAEIYKIWSDSNAAWHQLIGSEPDRNNHFARAVEAEVIRRTAQAHQPVAWVKPSDLAELSTCNGMSVWLESGEAHYDHWNHGGTSANGLVPLTIAAAPKAAPKE